MGMKTMPGPDELDAFVVRNTDVISAPEQAALRATRLLVAGCGSVGGSLVEPLVRLGIGSVVLADPETFDLSNINRQACLLSDVGQSKAEVLARRVADVNPFVDVRVFPAGLTEDNLEDAFDGTTVVFDAIDAASSPWVKYRVHELASERRIPVVAGFDFGGKSVLYVFDYRRKRAAPFYGRASAEAHREGRLSECLKWLGYTHFPADFLPIIQDRMITGKPWPQVSYCVLAMGALGTRCMVDLAMQRRVPHVIAFDTHMAMRTPLGRLVERLKIPGRLLGALAAARRAAKARAARAEVPPEADDQLGIDPTLRLVIEAMARAPSPHNCQPWRFVVKGPREIAIGWDVSRALDAVDPDDFAIAYAIGCAVEAAATIAEVAFTQSGSGDYRAPGYVAGTLVVKALHTEGQVHRRGILDRRATYRGGMYDAVSGDQLADRLDGLVQPLRARAAMRELPPDLIRRMALEGAQGLFGRSDYVDELLRHIRIGRREADRDPTGFTARSLGLGPVRARLLSLLRSSLLLRRLAFASGIAKLMAHTSTSAIGSASSFVLVTSSDFSPEGRIDVGRAIMRVWLELTRQDLACQPIDFAICTNQSRAQILAMFNLPSTERPVLLFRVGKAASMQLPRSPRLPAYSLCHYAPEDGARASVRSGDAIAATAEA